MNLDSNSPETTEQFEVFAFSEIQELVRQALHPQPSGQTTGDTPFFGFKQIDDLTGGFNKGQLYTVVSKPGTGKTAFMLSVVNNLAVKNDFSVVIFSAERSGVKIAQRLIESETGIAIDKVRSGKLKDSMRDRFETLVSSIKKAKILVDDTKLLTVEGLVSKARAISQQQNFDLIVVDFLELLAANEIDLHPDDSVAKVVFALKELANELNIPVLLFSQLETSAGFFQKPSLNETPIALSEISDTILLLHRRTPAEIASNGAQKNVKIIVSKCPCLEEPRELNINLIEATGKFVDF